MMQRLRVIQWLRRVVFHQRLQEVPPVPDTLAYLWRDIMIDEGEQQLLFVPLIDGRDNGEMTP